ncbi:hypothetical protein QVD17_13888 [Tagetes erecta]|uniref:Uncharacterized protein n=1 Tax=Tagetes erecta TaxID=13708 RepID=A0AAD8KXL1_TARER|nr:hypothetical protein QVD17_13888 [Tagetes erecta]
MVSVVTRALNSKNLHTTKSKQTTLFVIEFLNRSFPIDLKNSNLHVLLDPPHEHLHAVKCTIQSAKFCIRA